MLSSRQQERLERVVCGAFPQYAVLLEGVCGEPALWRVEVSGVPESEVGEVLDELRWLVQTPAAVRRGVRVEPVVVDEWLGEWR